MADNIEKVKGMMAGGMASMTIQDNLADDVEWTSAISGTSSGKDAVKAMLEGQRAKMGDMVPEMSNWTASSADTVSFDIKMGENNVSASCTLNADGKITKWVTAKK